ncbi:MAG TPA: SCE4755 family polysaccharide monooxygenase-like protein [Polyangia bacterium]|nr:SCE4755 family polysaccharide monooxygenase-like protein [Polyangia bacterium]
MRKVLLASTIALLGLTSTAHAHFGLVNPPQVVAQSDVSGKGSPPCGPDTGAAATPTAVMGGHTLNIKVFESVGHLGFYRVALALHSRSELPVDNVVYDAQNKVLPPSGMPSGMSDHADFENPAKFPVLADNFMAHEKTAPNSTPYNGDVMIPNVACDRCVLQVIEFMHPHGFNTSVPGPGGGYFYHHCAEIKITPDPNLPLYNPDGGATDAGTDAATGGTGGSAGAAGAAGSGATAGNGGAAGSAGTTGTAGAAGGSSGGTAGTGASGAAGSNGAAGSASSGTAGAGSGTAGATAGATGHHQGGGGGCSIASTSNSSVLVASLMALALAMVVWRGRRARRER